MNSIDTISTRSIVSDYFDYRLRNRIIRNNGLLDIVTRIAADCETTYCLQGALFHFQSSLLSLTHVQSFHCEIGKELFNDENVNWTRIISFITFSAMLAEIIIQQQPQNEVLIITSFVDWTTNFIDINLHVWLEQQHYWSGCLNIYGEVFQMQNSIRRCVTVLGTLGIIIFGACYLSKN